MERQRRKRDNLKTNKRVSEVSLHIDVDAELDKALSFHQAGNLEHPNNDIRSIDLQQFSILFDVSACRFYSLQVGDRRNDIVKYNYSIPIIDLGVNFSDFSDTASAITELDLVISVDTSVAHLAGALGKDVWVLLAWIPDWRWLLEKEDTPWYPTMRLFRQTSNGDWESTFQRVQLALKQYVLKSRDLY